MAKQNKPAEGTLPLPTALEKMRKEHADVIGNEDFGTEVSRAIREKEVERIKTFVYGVAVRATATIDVLKDKAEAANKPNKGKNIPVKGKMGEFTREPYFDDAQAEKATKLTRAYNDLCDLYTTAYEKQGNSEEEWKAVENHLNVVDKLIK